jgi:hypothetical protein
MAKQKRTNVLVEFVGSDFKIENAKLLGVAPSNRLGGSLPFMHIEATLGLRVLHYGFPFLEKLANGPVELLLKRKDDLRWFEDAEKNLYPLSKYTVVNIPGVFFHLDDIGNEGWRLSHSAGFNPIIQSVNAIRFTPYSS